MHMSCVREKITLDNLIQLRKCRKSLQFNELSLNYKGFETAEVIRKAISSLKRKKEISREDAYKEVEEIFRKEYLSEYFDFHYQYEQVMERDLMRVKRIINYICDKGYSIIDTDVEFNIPINAKYRNYQINVVSGKVDFVFGKDDDVILVNVRSGENPYSCRARRVDTMEDNSMELLGVAYGLGSRYPNKHVFIESWYIKNKDDKTNSLVPEFNNKRGKNIARIMFTKESEIKERFYYVATFPEEGIEMCEGCIHKCVCQAKLEPHMDDVTEEMKISTPAALPSFTEDQKAVVYHMEGPMCVIAGPGAGKTYVLVNRLGTMLRKGIRPEKILFITFTKKAAAEIKERVMTLIGTTNEKEIPNIYTYNALGYTILKDNPMFLGKRIKLADKVDRYSMISEALNNSPKINNVSYDGIYEDFGLIRSLYKWFEQIDDKGKEAFSTENEGKKDVAGILSVYDTYTKIFNERGYISYDMQISLVNELFTKYPSLPAAYAKKYKYIMVDEYQDTSEDQANMTYSIAKKHGNIVVVGDDDQSIYGWRGGSNKYMLNFGQDFPNAKFVIMSDNFRSVNTILESANGVIANNGTRYEKELKGHKNVSYKPIYFKNYTVDKLASLVSEILNKGYQPGDIAILARDHKRLKEVYQVLSVNNKVAAPREFLYEDTIFQLLYDVLTLYYKGMDEDESFYRFLKVMGVEEIEKTSPEESLYKNMIATNRIHPIDKMDIHCLSTYESYKNVSVPMAAGYKLISCFKKIQYGKGLNAISDIVFEVFGLSNHKVIELLLDIADERAFVMMSQLYDIMQKIQIYGDDRTIEYEPSKDAVNLLTSHSSKGKEFPVVIVYATEDFSSNEEEIRLFYVSITRAKKTLIFVETVCNTCELFPKLQGRVVLG